MVRHWFSAVFCQAEDGIRDLVRSRGLGDVYKRQVQQSPPGFKEKLRVHPILEFPDNHAGEHDRLLQICLLYTSDAADERSSVDLGGRRIIKKTNSPPYDREPSTSHLHHQIHVE